MNSVSKPNRRTVLKLDLTLEIIGFYSGVRAAARANGMVHGSIRQYCNLTTKTAIAPGGFIYAWDDDRWLEKTLRRAMRELDALGIRYNDPHTSEYYNLPLEPGPADWSASLWMDAVPILVGGFFGRLQLLKGA